MAGLARTSAAAPASDPSSASGAHRESPIAHQFHSVAHFANAQVVVPLGPLPLPLLPSREFCYKADTFNV
jgi:hypothetical protein